MSDLVARVIAVSVFFVVSGAVLIVAILADAGVFN